MGIWAFIRNSDNFWFEFDKSCNHFLLMIFSPPSHKSFSAWERDIYVKFFLNFPVLLWLRSDYSRPISVNFNFWEKWIDLFLFVVFNCVACISRSVCHGQFFSRVGQFCVYYYINLETLKFFLNLGFCCIYMYVYFYGIPLVVNPL